MRRASTVTAKKGRVRITVTGEGEVVEGGLKCKGCGFVCPSQNDLNRHYTYFCPKGPKVKLKCKYCPTVTLGIVMGRHVKRCHPEVKHDARIKTADDKRLEMMLLKIGDPTGKRDFRDGFIMNMDRKRRIIRWSFEEVDPNCLNCSERRTEGSNWLTDKFLPTPVRLSMGNILAIRSHVWHFGHLVCCSYHRFDPKRRAAVTCSSVGCVQHSIVNDGCWHQLETSFKYLCLRYRTFVISATVLSAKPEMIGGKKKVAKADAFIKIAVALSAKGEWFYDAYVVPNNKKSTMSPNSYRKDLVHVNSLTNFKFLQQIKDQVKQRNLFDEGNKEKNRWMKENAQAQAESVEFEVSATVGEELGRKVEETFIILQPQYHDSARKEIQQILDKYLCRSREEASEAKPQESKSKPEPEKKKDACYKDFPEEEYDFDDWGNDDFK